MLTINSRIRDYEVHYHETLEFVSLLKQNPEYHWVIDKNVWELYSPRIFRDLDQAKVILFPIDEERKTLVGVQEIYDRLIEKKARRNTVLICVGGGILQDITGFVASTLFRGLEWVLVPTTLLAQADSCIGGKTSLNYKVFKNLLGTFYPPSRVLVCPSFLLTLNDIDFYSGLGEVLKLHLMGGENKVKELAGMLPGIEQKNPRALMTTIQSSHEIKYSYMREDEFDKGKRNLLNFGHCFGHALESSSRFAIPHGQAVILGILLANTVALTRGLMSEKKQNMIAEKLLLPALSVKLEREYFSQQPVVEAMKKDKKRIGEGLALVMMKNEYEMIQVNDLATAEVSIALDTIAGWLEQRGKFRTGDNLVFP